jgi:hypothetical protein
MVHHQHWYFLEGHCNSCTKALYHSVGKNIEMELYLLCIISSLIRNEPRWNLNSNLFKYIPNPNFNQITLYLAGFLDDTYFCPSFPFSDSMLLYTYIFNLLCDISFIDFSFTFLEALYIIQFENIQISTVSIIYNSFQLSF